MVDLSLILTKLWLIAMLNRRMDVDRQLYGSALHYSWLEVSSQNWTLVYSRFESVKALLPAVTAASCPPSPGRETFLAVEMPDVAARVTQPTKMQSRLAEFEDGCGLV